jgi:hypothetical protein
MWQELRLRTRVGRGAGICGRELTHAHEFGGVRKQTISGGHANPARPQSSSFVVLGQLGLCEPMRAALLPCVTLLLKYEL